MPEDRPVLLFAAPYFAPAYHGGAVQIYLGLLSRIKRFRVVVVADHIGVGPETAQAWDATAQSRFGFTVERLDAFEFHLPLEARSAFAKALTLVPSLLKFLWRGRRQWHSLCQKYAPAIIICGGTYSAGWLMPRNPSNSLLVNYVHGEELTMQVKPYFLQPLMRIYQRSSLRHAAKNLAVSRYTADLIAKIFGADPARITVLPNFIDHRRFHISGRREEIRKKHGWQDKVILLTIARLEKRKGIDQALRALALLNERQELRNDWKYMIAGKGAELEELQRLAEKLNVSSHVEFFGFVPDADVPGLYEAADVFLQPNREVDGDTEGFGVVFLEAAACGLPVIGGCAGGTADAIDHGRNGLRVDGDSVQEIADAVVLLMSDRELRLRFGSNGIEWAARFDVEETATAFEEMLLQMLAPQVLSEAISHQ